LNPNKGLVRTRVAAVATAGKLVEGDHKFSAALCFDRFLKLRYSWNDDGLDHLGKRAHEFPAEPCDEVQTDEGIEGIGASILDN
jgi:hypothetical protein